MRGEIGRGEEAAPFLHVGGDRLRDRTAVKRVASAARNLFERRREIRVLEHVAGRRRAAGRQERRRRRRILRQCLLFRLPLFRDDLADREAFARVADRGFESLRERNRSVLCQQLVPSVDDAGHADREDAAIGNLVELSSAELRRVWPRPARVRSHSGHGRSSSSRRTRSRRDRRRRRSSWARRPRGPPRPSPRRRWRCRRSGGPGGRPPTRAADSWQRFRCAPARPSESIAGWPRVDRREAARQARRGSVRQLQRSVASASRLTLLQSVPAVVISWPRAWPDRSCRRCRAGL